MSPSNSDLNPDFLDMLDSFREMHVEFIVVGAYALAVQGLARATEDIADVAFLKNLPPK